jgi:uncharacterized protein (DUF433 family)
MDAPSAIFQSDPDILGGSPVFVGTRVPVQTLLDYLKAGDTLEDFLDDFPSVTRAQAVGMVQFAIQSLEPQLRQAAGDLPQAVQYVLSKNAELYRRLA